MPKAKKSISKPRKRGATSRRMRQEYGIAVSFSAEFLDSMWDLETTLRKVLRKEFGRTTDVVGSGVGRGVCDISIVTKVQNPSDVAMMAQQIAFSFLQQAMDDLIVYHKDAIDTCKKSKKEMCVQVSEPHLYATVE